MPPVSNAPGFWDFMISYTQRNPHSNAVAVDLWHSLQGLGHSCWLDVKMACRDEAAMEEGVRNSSTLIAVISDGNGVKGNSYFERAYCLKELRWATDSNICIQPVVRAEDKKRIGEFVAAAPDDLKFIGSINFIHLDCTDASYWDLGVSLIVQQCRKRQNSLDPELFVGWLRQIKQLYQRARQHSEELRDDPENFDSREAKKHTELQLAQKWDALDKLMTAEDVMDLTQVMLEISSTVRSENLLDEYSNALRRMLTLVNEVFSADESRSAREARCLGGCTSRRSEAQPRGTNFQHCPNNNDTLASLLRDLRGADNNTALHIAASINLLWVVRFLTANEHTKHLVNMPNAQSWTPLHTAARFGHLEVCTTLVQAGATTTLITRVVEDSLKDSQETLSNLRTGNMAMFGGFVAAASSITSPLFPVLAVPGAMMAGQSTWKRLPRTPEDLARFHEQHEVVEFLKQHQRQIEKAPARIFNAATRLVIGTFTDTACTGSAVRSSALAASSSNTGPAASRGNQVPTETPTIFNAATRFLIGTRPNFKVDSRGFPIREVPDAGAPRANNASGGGPRDSDSEHQYHTACTGSAVRSSALAASSSSTGPAASRGNQVPTESWTTWENGCSAALSTAILSSWIYEVAGPSTDSYLVPNVMPLGARTPPRAWAPGGLHLEYLHKSGEGGSIVQWAILTSSDTIYVVFKGSDSILDGVVDLCYSPCDFAAHGVQVHSGMYLMLHQRVYPAVSREEGEGTSSRDCGGYAWISPSDGARFQE
ncbi:hypothetical protein CYMTET_38170 [Cymbomonas tetramitiformis]|uniref:Uncharacterized protein n=1 Tax=Cymbomonas tetramitiformis TaxID=36881 RepID=A0AAE0CCK9_9CHLO|nr:hypothetical protein CYMTET_38170 [Cymbomonas tetramitiformis]